MKTKIFRLIFALALMLSALGISTSAVLANQVIKIEDGWTYGATLTDVCAYPIVFSGTILHTYETLFFDNNGTLIKMNFHSIDQDTFSANGKTLVSLPIYYAGEAIFDSNGNVTHLYMNGINEKIRLPDGSLFIASGRYDWAAHPGEIVLSPDKGNPGNLVKFCEALAP